MEPAGWALALAADLTVLVTGPVLVAFIVTVAVAGLWCRALDQEEHRIQVVDVEPPVLNLYPTQGSVSR